MHCIQIMIILAMKRAEMDMSKMPNIKGVTYINKDKKKFKCKISRTHKDLL